MKTHKGAAKRFGVTGSGKVVRVKAWRGHHLDIKSSSRTRRYAGKAVVDGTSAEQIRGLLPYIGKKGLAMARIKRGVTAHRRHKRLLKAAEGRRGTKSRLIKPAREALLHAMAYSYVGRKQRKRQMRALWIVRLNAAARQNGMTYAKLVAGLKRAGVALDRKILADIAVRDAATFASIAEVARAS
jgi:large subunit ribosomal protein L20